MTHASLPSVSVVVPTHNRGDLLSAAVESTLGQTHRPLEVLVVDDGSTDDTEAICARWGRALRYVRQANAGVSAARNRGIAEAQGDYVAFLDADDVWYPRKLEVQLAALAAHSRAAWCLTGCRVIGRDGQPRPEPQGLSAVSAVFTELGLTPEAFFGLRLARSELDAAGARHIVFVGDAFGLLFYGNFVLPSSALVRRNVVARLGGFDESFRVAEETEFFHRLAADSQLVVVLSPLVAYRAPEAGSLTAPTNTPRLIENALRSLELAAGRRASLTRFERRAYEAGRARLLQKLAYTHLSVLDRAGARAALQRARAAGIRLSPALVALYAASLFPALALRGLHAVKRRLRR